jgi:hypothetical protein
MCPRIAIAACPGGLDTKLLTRKPREKYISINKKTKSFRGTNDGIM